MRRLIWGLGVAGLAAWACAAWARNPHCAGGIQYVSQGMRDKEKPGGMEDYLREMNKAIVQLNLCAKEDPDDYEAIGYLGWAYCELDSAEQAGRAFKTAIDGLTAKGDKKKADWAISNRESFFARYFNAGIDRISAGQIAYPDMTKKPETPTDEAMHAEATKAYQAALAHLHKALHLKPGDARTYHNLGAVHTFMGDFAGAEQVFKEGLTHSPQDSVLLKDLSTVGVSGVQRLIDAKDYDGAIATLGPLIAKEPASTSLHGLMADAYFRKAQESKGEDRSKAFALAGDHYAKVAELRPNESEAAFNAGSAYNAAGQWVKAEPFWRRALALQPDDVDALSALGACLAEQGKFKEAIEVLHRAVVSKPREQSLHRQLGGVYTKAGKDQRGTEELVVYLALRDGRPAANPAAKAEETAKKFAGSDAAKTWGALGAPESVLSWDAQGMASETWLYLAKQQAYTFSSGKQTFKTDWSAPDVQGLPGAAAPPAPGKK